MLQIKNYVNSSNTSTSRSVLFMPPYINKLSYSNSSRVQTNNHHACIALLWLKPVIWIFQETILAQNAGFTFRSSIVITNTWSKSNLDYYDNSYAVLVVVLIWSTFYTRLGASSATCTKQCTTSYLTNFNCWCNNMQFQIIGKHYNWFPRYIL